MAKDVYKWAADNLLTVLLVAIGIVASTGTVAGRLYISDAVACHNTDREAHNLDTLQKDLQEIKADLKSLLRKVQP